MALLLFALAPALAVAKPARGAAESGPWLQALSSAFVVVDMAQGDLDQDGREETVVCFVEPKGGSSARGGIAVLARRDGERPVFQALLDEKCARVKISGGKLGVLLESKKQRVLTYGREIVFTTDPRHPLAAMKAQASSTVDGGRTNDASKAIDGDLSTSWAEGASGTGIGETITLTLPQKTHVAYLAILGGHTISDRTYYDANRIHRASLEIQTEADLGDDEAGIDFSELGIDIGGDRVAVTLENRPEIRYVRIDKQDVRKIELRIDSVFLGKRDDDTHVSEIVVIPVLDARALAGTAGVAKGEPEPGKGTSKSPKQGDAAAGDEDDSLPVLPDARADALVNDLDRDGRSIVRDDDF